MRSLTAGVTGMLNNQLSLDVIANNLANSNTPGFKSGRVSFSNSLVQTHFTGSAPGANLGGRNPQQVGLGVNTASVGVDMSQGALLATGRDLDLAIQGEGFFEITDGTRNLYTRVGTFGIDSENNLYHQGTGMRVIGNTYTLDPNPDGSQNIDQIGTPLNVDLSASFPPSRTNEIDFQGNLSSQTRALRGPSLNSVFQLVNSADGSLATEDTRLQNLEIFNDSVGTPGTDLDIHIFGTKPDGTAYGGTVTIQPWDEPTSADPSGSLGDMVSKINNVLSQGNERFGTMRIENGNLIATGIGTGDGFSLFMGENNPMAGVVAQPALTNIDTAAATDGIGYDGVAREGQAADSTLHTVPAGGIAGLYQPTFTVPSVDFITAGTATAGQELRITMQVNGNAVGEIRIPAADYATGGISREFSLASWPHVRQGDTVSFALSGDWDMDADAGPNNGLSLDTRVVSDANPNNLTADQNADNIPDIFQENSATDVNAWVYRNETNTSFDWYRARMVPESVASSIEIFDSQGGRHTVEARFIRTGTRTQTGSDIRLNNWDMMINVPESEGVMTDSLIAGLEFDQEGRFTGSVGTTSHGTTLDALQYVGSPATQSIQVDWNATGATDPATIRADFGEANTFSGLTGFGSASTAAAVDQDGFPDGQLDSVSVSAEGDLTALYTNGISRRLAQLSLVTFRNPDGLTAAEDNLWQQSTNSGNATRRVPGTGAGFITAGSLEGGNVDIATEFSRLITAQRGFQVSSRLIQTTDEVLEELANLTR
jgi:flagellar hook protein FlgE